MTNDVDVEIEVSRRKQLDDMFKNLSGHIPKTQSVTSHNEVQQIISYELREDNYLLKNDKAIFFPLSVEEQTAWLQSYIDSSVSSCHLTAIYLFAIMSNDHMLSNLRDMKPLPVQNPEAQEEINQETLDNIIKELEDEGDKVLHLRFLAATSSTCLDGHSITFVKLGNYVRTYEAWGENGIDTTLLNNLLLSDESNTNGTWNTTAIYIQALKNIKSSDREIRNQGYQVITRCYLNPDNNYNTADQYEGLTTYNVTKVENQPITRIIDFCVKPLALLVDIQRMLINRQKALLILTSKIPDLIKTNPLEEIPVKQPVPDNSLNNKEEKNPGEEEVSDNQSISDPLHNDIDDKNINTASPIKPSYTNETPHFFNKSSASNVDSNEAIKTLIKNLDYEIKRYRLNPYNARKKIKKAALEDLLDFINTGQTYQEAIDSVFKKHNKKQVYSGLRSRTRDLFNRLLNETNPLQSNNSSRKGPE